MIYTVKGIVNEADVCLFVCLFNLLAFSMIQQMLAIRSLVPLPFLNPACTLKVLVHILLKPSLKDLEHYLLSL